MALPPTLIYALCEGTPEEVFQRLQDNHCLKSSVSKIQFVLELEKLSEQLKVEAEMRRRSPIPPKTGTSGFDRRVRVIRSEGFLNNRGENLADTRVEWRISTLISIEGKHLQVTLDSEPLLFGREVENLPPQIIKLFEEDEYVSRKHCQIWYEGDYDAICIENFSTNGTTVNNNLLAEGEALKLDFGNNIELQIGKTILRIVRQEIEEEPSRLIIPPIQQEDTVSDGKTKIYRQSSHPLPEPIEPEIGPSPIAPDQTAEKKMSGWKILGGFFALAAFIYIIMIIFTDFDITGGSRRKFVPAAVLYALYRFSSYLGGDDDEND